MPDWFRGDQWQNPSPMVQEINVAQTGIVNYGLFNVQQWEQLLISIVSTAAVGGSIAWFTDPGGLDQIGFQTFTSTAAFGYVDTLPVIGPYVNVSVAWNLASSPVTESMFLLPVRGSDPWKRPLNNLVIAHDPGVVIAGGGGAVNRDGAFTTTGRAIIAVGTDSPNWIASVFPLAVPAAQDGQLALLGTSIPGPSSSAELALPAQTVRVTMVNNDANPHTFRMSLVIAR